MDELIVLIEEYFKKYDEPKELYDINLALGYKGAVAFLKKSKGKKITFIKPDERARDDFGEYIF